MQAHKRQAGQCNVLVGPPTFLVPDLKGLAPAQRETGREEASQYHVTDQNPAWQGQDARVQGGYLVVGPSERASAVCMGMGVGEQEMYTIKHV